MAKPKTVLDSVATSLGEVTAVVLGLSAGAMLAEGAVLVPWWRSLPPGSFLQWYASNATRLFDFFGPLEIAGAGLALGASALHLVRGRPAGAWFVASTVLAVAILSAFPIYFQEANASFATGTIEPERVGSELARWASWHWGRTALGILACGAAVRGVRATGADEGA